MLDWQIEVDGLLLGPGTKYRVSAFDHEKPQATRHDVRLPRSDGIRFGRDTLGGTVFTLDIGLYGVDPGDTLDLLSALSDVWDARSVRFQPGRTVVLRYRMPGRTARRVHGRPRKFAPATLENVVNKVIPVTCEFQAEDPYFYDDAEQSVHITLIPPDAQTGVTVPFTVPFQFAGRSQSQGDVVVGGTVPSPVTLRINGPVTDPTVSVLGEFSITLRGSLASDDYVTVDPLDRTVVTRFGQNWAGRFTADSQPLPDIRLSPGEHQVVLRGTDATGTASLDVLWRNTYASF